MHSRTMWIVVSTLMGLSLVFGACAPAATTPVTPTTPATTTSTPSTPANPAPPVAEKPQQEAVKPTAETPRYGGTVSLVLNSDITGWDDIVTRSVTPGATFRITNESMWAGDWSKGPAGGYGANVTDWGGAYDLFDQKEGMVAESTKWTVDTANSQATIVYQIRQGTHYALNPASEASRSVGGREVTADDVVFSLKQTITSPTAYVYKSNPELRTANITKTGPQEVTVKVSLDALMTGISRLGNYGRVVPPEVVAKYGNMANWKNSVGSGPFMLTDYVPGSQAIMTRNPKYWDKDPIGPGKGNQLPYIDIYRYLIIPDASTRQAALRAGKIDQMTGISWTDTAQLVKTTPALKQIAAPVGGFPTYMRTDKPPFNDVRVRRAMMMATDFEKIKSTLNGGLGQILNFPFAYNKAYADLYLGLDDPAMPASVKELYTYNPDKAKQLLKDAGYPTGFKTSVLIPSTNVDYYSVIKDMWSKVGIELSLDVRDTGVITTLAATRNYDALKDGAGSGLGPISVFYVASSLVGEGAANASMINDPVVNKAVTDLRLASITDLHKGMSMMKDLMPYFLDQVYAIPTPTAPTYVFWWPWVKNYSGETDIGYFCGDRWTTFAWYDSALKKSMGY